jgi:hypothetical protein
LKSGQIAHLDRNNQNASEDNLCFLCLEHHDEYDSSTSQRKGLTQNEVRSYRQELHEAIDGYFSLDVHFGEIELPPNDPFAGHYTRVDTDGDSAEIQIVPIPDDLEGLPRYFVCGLALFGSKREYGPNIGELSLLMTMYHDAELQGSENFDNGDSSHIVQINFRDDKVTIKDEHSVVVYGAGVTFEGTYRRS